jgi:hypothetical protein
MGFVPVGVGPSSATTPVSTPDPSFGDFPSNTNMSWSGTAGTSTNYGDNLATMQGELVGAGYYKSNDMSEADGKFGQHTAAAFSQLQSDLNAAGVYSGPTNGQFNNSVTQGLNSLKQNGIPAGLDPATTQRLQSLMQTATPVTVTAAAPPPIETTSAPISATLSPSSFDPSTAATRPQAISTPAPPAAQDTGNQRINATVAFLGSHVNTQQLTQQLGHTPTTADFETACANLADNLRAQPNTRQILSAYAGNSLGFNPMHNSEADVDNFLGGVSGQLRKAAAVNYLSQ